MLITRWTHHLTHGRGGLERWMMGSVTEHVLNATKLPVLIVRPQNVATK